MEFPGHRPDESLMLRNLCDSLNPLEVNGIQSTLCSNLHAKAASLSPYPNLNSFELEDWYWNTGVQKSQSNFKALINIIGSPEFRPEEVRNTNWTGINAVLASNQTELGDNQNSDLEWLDNGWKSSNITINVPFHQRTDKPGTQSYITGKLYHRSLVSVVREQLESLDEGARFHFEPYELYWDLGSESENFHVNREIYMSD